MFRNVLQNCFVTGALAAAVSACAFGPPTEGGAQDSEAPEFASDAEEAAWIRQALAKDPKDPLATRMADQFNARSDQKLGLLATVDVGRGRVVKFFQNIEGVNSISTEGPIDAPKLGVRFSGRTLSDIYGELKPAEAIPDAIVEADARTQELMLRQAAEVPQMPASAESAALPPETPETQAQDDSEELIDKDITCDDFRNEGCAFGGAWDACNCNLQNGDESLSFNNVTRSHHAAAARNGNIMFEALRNGQVIRQRFLDEGQMYGFYVDTPGVCGPDVGLWQASGVEPCRATHAQNVFAGNGQRFHRNLCIERINSPLCL